MVVDEKTRMFEPPAPGQAEKRDRAYLVVLAGSAVGEMYKVDQERTIIGRGGKATIRLIDDGISREHAEIVVQGNEVFLHDLGSTNGTFCNGVKVDKKPLADGDKILVGSTTILKFTYHDNLDEVFQRQMYESALRDGLTKAFNKKYFTDRLESEFMFSVRHSSPLTLVMFDIDHFKKINDTYGHQAGDAVLTDLSALMMMSLRTEDVFARYGGEEFAVICRGSDLAQGQVIGERLRRASEGRQFGYDGKVIPVTISVGLAGMPDAAIKDASGLVSAADAALYRSKQGGRNRVSVHMSI
ncbi:MAG: GGDEF domain-containing protein [Deltaproteobacteria bacterium]|nr:GGDEF domain-containing protein [Deltaproteobacteria bacterium]